jgi:hypothetical protein
LSIGIFFIPDPQCQHAKSSLRIRSYVFASSFDIWNRRLRSFVTWFDRKSQTTSDPWERTYSHCQNMMAQHQTTTRLRLYQGRTQALVGMNCNVFYFSSWVNTNHRRGRADASAYNALS